MVLLLLLLDLLELGMGQVSKEAPKYPIKGLIRGGIMDMAHGCIQDENCLHDIRQDMA